MAYDLEEQEQLDAIKQWWKANGSKVMALVLLVIAGFLAAQGWKYYQHKQSLAASAQYQLLIKTDPANLDQIKTLSAKLMQDYASTPYAGRAAVLAANANHAAQDSASAKAQLEWAVNNAKEDEMKALASLQLAAIQLEEQAFDAALKTLDNKHSTGFEGLYADLKGDVLAAQGKTADARQAYQLALSMLDKQGRYYRYTEHKLQALGS